MKNKKNLYLYILITFIFLIALFILPLVAKLVAYKLDGDLVVAKVIVNFFAFLLVGILFIIFKRDFKKGFFNILLYFIISIYFQATFALFNLKGFWKTNLFSLIPDLIICLVFIIINKKLLKNKLKDFKLNFKQYINLIFKYWIVGCILMIVSNILISTIFGGAPVNELENRKLMAELPLYFTLITIILTPITEELVFRGAFKKCFKDLHIVPSLT